MKKPKQHAAGHSLYGLGIFIYVCAPSLCMFGVYNYSFLRIILNERKRRKESSERSKTDLP